MQPLSKFGKRRTQSGVGLIEVMVALLLLAIGVLGYIALQSAAVRSTSDSIVRSNILTNIRDLSDSIRYNPSAIDSYVTKLNEFNSGGSKPKSCEGSVSCTPAEQAAYDSSQAAERAQAGGYQLGMVVCPNTAGKGVMETRCLVGSWNDTTPTAGTSSDTDCLDSSGGNYFRGADCLVVEVQ